MIIHCPGCRKKISNKHQACPHCRFDLSGSGAGLSLAEAERRRQRRLRYRLAMHSYAAMMVTVAGAAWMYFSSAGFERAPGFWPTACMAAGALWYVAARVYSILVRLRR